MGDTNTSNVIPNSGAAPSGGDILSTGSSNVLQQALFSMAAMLGQGVARQHILDGTITPELHGHILGGVMPQMAPPVVTPPPMQPGFQGTAAQYWNPEQRKIAGMTDLVNNVRSSLNAYMARKHERDTQLAARDFQQIMTATQMNRMLNPDDPVQAAQIQHNNKLIQDFFEQDGGKRAQKMMKILGYDAYDAKGQAQKEQSPEYQGFKQALANAQKAPLQVQGAPMANQIPMSDAPEQHNLDGQPSQPLVASLGAPPIAPAQPNAATTPSPIELSQPQGMRSPLADDAMRKTYPGFESLPPAAQKFLAQQPFGYTQPQYMFSPDEIAHQALVAAKLAPDANTLAGIIPQVQRWQMTGMDHLLTTASQTNIEQMKLNMEKWKDVNDQTVKWNLGILTADVDRQKNQIELYGKNIEKARLDFDKGRATAQDVSKSFEDQLAAFQHINQDLMQQQQHLQAELTKGYGLSKDQRANLSKQLTNINDQFAENTNKYFDVMQNKQAWENGAYGKPQVHSGGAAAKSIGDKLIASATGQPSASPANGAPPSSSQPVSGGNAGGTNVSGNPPASSGFTNWGNRVLTDTFNFGKRIINGPPPESK